MWTPWNTLLAAEEASGGHVYEIDPRTGASVARPAIGLREHEGMRFDSRGTPYGISENHTGHIFRFVPDRRGDLSSGRLHALEVRSCTSR